MPEKTGMEELWGVRGDSQWSNHRLWSGLSKSKCMVKLMLLRYCWDVKYTKFARSEKMWNEPSPWFECRWELKLLLFGD